MFETERFNNKPRRYVQDIGTSYEAPSSRVLSNYNAETVSTRPGEFGAAFPWKLIYERTALQPCNWISAGNHTSETMKITLDSLE
jgi:hypothetical protein